MQKNVFLIAEYSRWQSMGYLLLSPYTKEGFEIVYYGYCATVFITVNNVFFSIFFGHRWLRKMDCLCECQLNHQTFCHVPLHFISFCWLAVLNFMALFELVNSFFLETSKRACTHYKIFHICVKTEPIVNYESIKTKTHFAKYILEIERVLVNTCWFSLPNKQYE